jgi:ABC-type phosphate/phosphonate transport system substrate-binding protein
MIASLPMYDWPEVREATDALWTAIAARLGVAAPLDRSHPFDGSWRRPDLLLSQTCGYPLTHELRGSLSYVATPHYSADGCDGPRYRSILFAREAMAIEKFRGRTAAVNSGNSMSGMLALKLMIGGYKELPSGSHTQSLELVRDGHADICAVDCVCAALARRWRPQLLEGLVEIARSPLVPGLPFVTRSGDVARLRDVLLEIFNNKTNRSILDALMITGLSVLDDDAYDVIPQLEAQLDEGKSHDV